MLKIAAENTGKSVGLVTLTTAGCLEVTHGHLGMHDYPYAIIDGMVYHSTSKHKCQSCKEHFWKPLNESWEDFSKGWRVVNK